MYDDQCLIFDGDDTLWENNTYFERSIEEFIDLIKTEHLGRDEVRGILDDIERANVKIHGYGARSFVHSLHECYERIHQRVAAEEDALAILALGERILSQPMEIIDGVEATLSHLRGRHRLVLLTKGHAEEQQLKVERCGLRHFFDDVIIVPEKDVQTYLDAVGRLGSEKDTTWMIGNSPKSDINPALAAGLGAVYVPHDETWSLEHAPFADGATRLLVVERFADLTDHF
jgi:putative hydrolase of the HAD superfamily